MKIIPSPLLVIHIQPDVFSFGEKGNLALDTCIHIRVGSDGNLTVVEIGERSMILDRSQRLELFQDDGFRHPGIDRSDLFNLWFRLGYSSWASQNRSIFRSTILFRNSDSLTPILLGYEKEILEQAGRQAGSKKVIFE